MRGMNDPEIKPAPSVPWYRAIVTRTPRGRKLRRRTLLVFAILTVPWWLRVVYWSPRIVAGKLGLMPMPEPVHQPCHRPSDCTKTTCAYGYPICVLGAYGSDPKDPAGGICNCLSKEQDAANRRPPPGCKGARLVRETPNGFDWECTGGTDLGGNIDGGRQEGGP
jgi:hypothetical protein